MVLNTAGAYGKENVYTWTVCLLSVLPLLFPALDGGVGLHIVSSDYGGCYGKALRGNSHYPSDVVMTYTKYVLYTSVGAKSRWETQT